MPSLEFPRTFVPESADLGNWSDIEPLFRQLLEREIGSAGDLEQWLFDWSEFAAAISEVREFRYIEMTCHTDDPERERRYLDFVENVEPKIKPYADRLNHKYVESPFRAQLPRGRYHVLDRNIQADVRLFREANIPLETEESILSQKYQKIRGAMTVVFDGQERTMPQMEPYFEEPDRAQRQAAWETVTERRLRDRDAMDEIYDRMVALRHTIARNADFDDYRGFAFMMYKRFDYAPADAVRFQESIEKWIVPASRRLGKRRREQLGLDRLRPWDLAVDPKGRAPLRPFKTGEELCGGVEEVFAQLDSELAAQFAEMKTRGELDLESRKGKAPGGYLDTLNERRRPFIFMNAAGVHRDVETLLHESGHAFHAVASREEPLLEYRANVPLEFAEVASMSMELFGLDRLGVFYSPEDAARAKRMQFESIINFFPWMARIDAFQHWVYASPGHTREERSRQWLALDERFGRGEDWSGHEAARESNWHRQLHLFTSPFYYIEYGIAQLGALQLWRNFKREPQGTLRRYRSALALGNSRPLPELFEAAGAKFDFSEETIRPLIEMVEEDLSKAPE